VPAKPPQIALKRTNNGIRRASTVFSIPFLPPLSAWTSIPKHFHRFLLRQAIGGADGHEVVVDERE
jgi:hypothetical protein